MWLQLCDINTHSDKVFHHFSVIWEFSSLGYVKINIDNVVRDSLDLVACGDIFCESMTSSLVVYLLSLIFIIILVSWVYEFIHVIETTKIMSFLVFGLNVILPIFLSFLLLGLMFLWFSVICETNALIIMRKSDLGFLTFFCKDNVCADKLANLSFIHRKQFHWYKKVPCNLFLEFFINRYRLLKYRFSYILFYELWHSPHICLEFFFFFFHNTFFIWWQMIVKI